MLTQFVKLYSEKFGRRQPWGRQWSEDGEIERQTIG